MLTINFPFSEGISVLDAGFPADDRQALRSFTALHDVRPLDIACISVVRLFLTLYLAILKPYNRKSNLQRSYRHSQYQRGPCFHSRGELEGEKPCVMILLRSMERQGTSTLPYSNTISVFQPLVLLY